MPSYRIRSIFLSLLAAILLLGFSGIFSAGESQSPGIKVQLKRGHHLSLHFFLVSGAKSTVKIRQDQLPWASGDSLVLSAATNMGGYKGQSLNRDVPVDDPMFYEIQVEPNTPLSGDVDLETVFPDLRRLSKTTDVQLFWAYKSPKELNFPRWSGGWILIPKQE